MLLDGKKTMLPLNDFDRKPKKVECPAIYYIILFYVLRLPNNYGYGQDVLNIAWTTIDSVKNLVNKVGLPLHSNTPLSPRTKREEFDCCLIINLAPK